MPAPVSRPGRTMVASIAALPQRLFLAVVSAGVIGGLTIAAGGVWLQAKLVAARRR